MYFAYFDESGDSGTVASQTNTFALSCILLSDKDWLSASNHCFPALPKQELSYFTAKRTKGELVDPQQG